MTVKTEIDRILFKTAVSYLILGEQVLGESVYVF